MITCIFKPFAVPVSARTGRFPGLTLHSSSASYLQLRLGHFSTLLDVQGREGVPYRLEQFGF